MLRLLWAPFPRLAWHWASRHGTKGAERARPANDGPAAERLSPHTAAIVASLLLGHFVTLGTYLVIAAGSVTHRQLFLETPIKLPLLDVELPLVAFFVIAPWFFVVFHFYLLLQLVLLTKKVARYVEILKAPFPGDATNDESIRNLQLQLPNDILVQFLAGPRGDREGSVRFMLLIVAWVTIVSARSLCSSPCNTGSCPIRTGG